MLRWTLMGVGVALALIGVYVLLRRPHLPGGQLEFGNLKVDSKGAGLPLVAIGVIALVAGVFIEPSTSTTGTPERSATHTAPASGDTTERDKSVEPASPSTTPADIPTSGPASPTEPARRPTRDVQRLQGLKPVVGKISAGEQKVDGRIYPSALWWNERDFDACDDLDPLTVDFDVNRQFRFFVAVVGMGDDSSSEVTAQFRVYGDGKLLTSVSTNVGEHTPLRISVSGVHRLRLTARLSEEAVCGTPAKAVWANPRLTP